MKIFTVMGTDQESNSWVWGSFSSKANAKIAIRRWQEQSEYFVSEGTKFTIVKDRLDDFSATEEA